MKLDSLLEKNHDAIIEITTKYGAQSVRIFGSRARGTSQNESDVDLLVTLEPGRTLLDLVAIKQDIEDLTRLQGGYRHGSGSQPIYSRTGVK